MAFNYAGLGSVLQGAGAIYGAYNQKKTADRLYKMQLNEYKDEKKRKKRSQARLDYAADHYLSHQDNDARLPIQY